MDNPEPSAADCPDPFAWTLLRMCREDSAFLLTMVRDVWTKLLVTGARREDVASGEAMDGQVTLELIERIQAMRKKALA